MCPPYLCSEKKERDYVLNNIKDLVVKETNAAGGYGMLIGPKSSKKEHEMFKGRIKKNPRNYIAQPTISLSKVPSFIDDHFEGRHVDLRPYILYGKNIEVVPGGLTRVTLKKGSCRDLTVLAMAICRNVGIASRFVSGYLYIPSARGHELHAWFEVYIPGGGWNGFDSMIGLAVQNNHIAVVTTANPDHSVPITGSIRGSAKSKLTTKVQVKKLRR